MKMSATNLDQVAFHDVSTYFSEEEWKLLHEWQKDLYRNVMNEIHQALLSLGPLIASTVRSLRAKEELRLVETPYRESIHRIRHSQKSPLLRVTKEEPHSIVADRIEAAVGENHSEHHSGYDIVSFCIKDENRPAYMNHEDSFKVKNISQTFSDGIKRTRSKTGGSKKYPLEKASVESGKSNLTFGSGPEDNTTFAHSSEYNVSFIHSPEDSSTFFHSPANNATFVENHEDNATFIHRPNDNASFIDIPEESVTFIPSPEHNSTFIYRSANNESFVQSPQDNATFIHSPENNPAFIHSPENDTTFIHSPKVNSTFVDNPENKAFVHNGENNMTYARRPGCSSQMSEQNEAPQIYPLMLQRSEKYACETNQKQTNLIAHRIVSQQDHRLHSCTECGKSFSRKGDLGKHKKIHTGVKPFQCTECKKSFNRKENLVVHKRLHTGVKPYCCNFCGKRFTQKVTLEVHQRTHSKNKPFQCSQCGKIFFQKGNLIQHQNTHTQSR